MPLIGFGGAPFTLASYAIEGGPSTDYARTKAFMYAQPARLAPAVRAFARRDGRLPAGAGRGGRAGAADLRLVGGRSRAADYREFALPHTPRIFERSRDVGVPIDPLRRRHDRDPAGPRARQAATSSASTGGCRSTRRGRASGTDRGIQGNLDPTLLLGPPDRLLAAADDVLRRAAGRAGTHLQSRPRHSARDAGRARAGAGAARARARAEIRKKSEFRIQESEFRIPVSWRRFEAAPYEST